MKNHLSNVAFVVAGFFSPVIPFFLLTGFLIFLDTCFGIWAAKKVGESVTSSKAARIVYKMLVYNVMVLTAYFLDVVIISEISKHFIDLPLPTTKIAFLTIAYNELYSIDEKIRKVKGEESGLWAMMKKMLSFAKTIKEKKDTLV
jgi:hypothetical protein